MKFTLGLLLAFTCLGIGFGQNYRGNPIITELYTADPCPIVHDDTLYIFTGHDEQNTVDNWFVMNDWYIFSTTDMYDYTNHGAKLSLSDFSWAGCCAFASHVTERDGKFYWYVSIRHKNVSTFEEDGEGFTIGVAVANHPTGPYEAVETPIFYDSTSNSATLDIDPAVYVDDDGQAYMYWGSWGVCRMVRLKDNMIEMEGEIETVSASNFFEAPFIHKYNDTYYLSYASHGYPSKTAYSVSTSITGPWTYKGVINGLLPVSETNHQGIVEFKDQWYFVYHNSQAPGGGVYRRSVCIDSLKYDESGNIRMVERTSTSVAQIGSISAFETLTNDAINIFPNPSAAGEINIDLSAIMNFAPTVDITIYSTDGESQLQLKKHNIDENVNADLNPGIYFIRITCNTQILSRKFVIL